VFAFESDPLPLPVGTVLADPGTSIVTHYFQRGFNFSGDPARTDLQLTTLIDDGAVGFLNGVKVTRINMPGGAADGTTRAAAEVSNATVSDPVTLPTANLVQGANVLSVSVHREPVLAAMERA